MRWKPYLCLIAAVGCGSLGGPPASDDVPNTGVAGWKKLGQRSGTSIVEPYVLCSGGNTFRAPSAIRRADGSFFMIYVTPAGALGRASGDDGVYDWSDGGAVSLPDAGPWREASVVEDAGDLVLAATADDGSRIAFFRSTDGVIWTAAGTITGASLGGAELLRDELLGTWTALYDAAERTEIRRATSSDLAAWTEDATPLFTIDDVRAAGWPALEIASPAAGLDTSRPGEPLYKIWFSARAIHGGFPFEAEWSIGFAGSFDAATGWQLYAGNPVLGQVSIAAPGQPIEFTDERAASVIALPNDEYLMYFEQPFEDLVSGVTRPCVALALTN